MFSTISSITLNSSVEVIFVTSNADLITLILNGNEAILEPPDPGTPGVGFDSYNAISK